MKPEPVATFCEALSGRRLGQARPQTHGLPAVPATAHHSCVWCACQVSKPDGSEQLLKAKNILIATGGAPTKLDIEGGEHAITSDEALALDNLPDKSVLIVGSG